MCLCAAAGGGGGDIRGTKAMPKKAKLFKKKRLRKKNDEESRQQQQLNFWFPKTWLSFFSLTLCHSISLQRNLIESFCIAGFFFVFARVSRKEKKIYY